VHCPDEVLEDLDTASRKRVEDTVAWARTGKDASGRSFPGFVKAAEELRMTRHYVGVGRDAKVEVDRAVEGVERTLDVDKVECAVWCVDKQSRAMVVEDRAHRVLIIHHAWMSDHSRSQKGHLYTRATLAREHVALWPSTAFSTVSGAGVAKKRAA
jgi:hypothetical protein